MNNSFEDFQSDWGKSRESVRPASYNIDDLIALAMEKQRSNLFFHYGNIFVLTVVVLALIIVWQLWMPFQEMLSIAGIGIMIGSLILRIILEAMSTLKSKKINLSESTRQTNQAMIRFYRYRKIMHGPITFVLVISYLVGFGLVLPELSLYVSDLLLAVFVTAFLASGVFIIYKVRQSIKKEMENLRFFLAIDKDLR